MIMVTFIVIQNLLVNLILAGILTKKGGVIVERGRQDNSRDDRIDNRRDDRIDNKRGTDNSRNDTRDDRIDNSRRDNLRNDR